MLSPSARLKLQGTLAKNQVSGGVNALGTDVDMDSSSDESKKGTFLHSPPFLTFQFAVRLDCPVAPIAASFWGGNCCNALKSFIKTTKWNRVPFHHAQISRRGPSSGWKEESEACKGKSICPLAVLADWNYSA